MKKANLIQVSSEHHHKSRLLSCQRGHSWKSVLIYLQHLQDTGSEKENIQSKKKEGKGNMNYEKRSSDTSLFNLDKTRLTGDVITNVKEHQMISCSLVHQWQERFILCFRK